MSNFLHATTDTNFIADTSTGLVLVDFWAEWCGPCKIMLPRLETLAEKMDGKARIMKLDVDDSPMSAQKYRVMSIPTMILFKDGIPVESVVGVRSAEELETMIAKHV